MDKGMRSLPKGQLGDRVEGCTSSPHTANSEGWHTAAGLFPYSSQQVGKEKLVQATMEMGC